MNQEKKNKKSSRNIHITAKCVIPSTAKRKEKLKKYAATGN